MLGCKRSREKQTATYGNSVGLKIDRGLELADTSKRSLIKIILNE